MKINLAENMLRFGAKNLTEPSKQKLEQLAEQELTTLTTTPIQIKSSVGSVFNVTPGVKLDGLNGKLVLDFAKNTVKLNDMVLPIGDLNKTENLFGVIKQMCMVWGATGNVDYKSWGPKYLRAAAAIKLFSVDKNIPSSFKVAFKEMHADLLGVSDQQSKDLAGGLNTPEGKKAMGVDTSTPLSVTSTDAGMIHYMMQQNRIS